MYKSVFLLGVALVLQACGGVKYKHYTHPEHGVGNMDNPLYVADLESCKSEVFSRGIFVNSVKITDVQRIEELDKEFSEWQKNEISAAFKERRNLGYVPVKYQDLDRARADRLTCIANKGWVR